MRQLFFLFFFFQFCCAYAQLSTYTYLPAIISECSGLEVSSNYLFSHNDSGDTNRLFRMNLDGSNLVELIIEGAENIDWEDIATDKNNEYLYIGDFGSNNFNFERDQRIIYQTKINSDFHLELVKEIKFHFEDYEDYTTHLNFDCEAMLSMDDRLLLFSKNHASSGYSKVYSLNKSDSIQTAFLIDSILTTNKVTASDVFLNEIALLTEGSVLLVELDLDDKLQLNQKIDLPFAKYEGITFYDRKNLIIGRDGESQELLLVSTYLLDNKSEKELYVNTNNNLILTLEGEFSNIEELKIFNVTGQLILTKKLFNDCQYYEIPLPKLAPQTLLVKFKTKNFAFVRKIMYTSY